MVQRERAIPVKLTMRYRNGKWIVHHGKRLTGQTLIAVSDCQFRLAWLVLKWQEATDVQGVVVRVKG